MAEYIEREAALREAESRIMWGASAAAVYESIRDVPAADVAPVRHGRWINGDQYCPICKKDNFRGLDADIWSDWKPDYCPNCGAKMDLEDAEKYDMDMSL